MVKSLTNLAVWLISGGLLAASLAFVAVATPLVGNRALIVRSGSMEPAISVGDVVIVREPRGVRGGIAYSVGDAIAYNVPGKEGMVVTHRITKVNETVNGTKYVTKGDANQEEDSWVVTEKDILGKEWLVVPWVGTLLAFAKSRVGFLSLVVVPAVVVILSELRVIWGEFRKKSRVPVLARGKLQVVSPVVPSLPAPVVKVKTEIRPAIAVSFVGAPAPRVRRFVDGVSQRSMLSVMVILLMVSLMTPATFALLSDTGTSSNNVFAAAEVFPTPSVSPSPSPSPSVSPSPSPSVSPSPTPGPGDVVINEVMWMGSTGSTADEWIELRNMTGNSVSLTGWKIQNAGTNGANADISLTGSIPANGFWLLGNFSTDHASSKISNSISEDQEDNSVSLDNTPGEQLTLRDGASVLIDQTPSGSWPAGENNTGQDTHKSMERNNVPGVGTVSTNWHTCIDDACNDGTYWDDNNGNNYGTPKATNL